jgi:hypothetical protein
MTAAAKTRRVVCEIGIEVQVNRPGQVTLQVGLCAGLGLHQIVTAVDQQDLSAPGLRCPSLRTQ